MIIIALHFKIFMESKPQRCSGAVVIFPIRCKAHGFVCLYSGARSVGRVLREQFVHFMNSVFHPRQVIPLLVDTVVKSVLFT